jgi:hypothetical protein
VHVSPPRCRRRSTGRLRVAARGATREGGATPSRLPPPTGEDCALG